MFRRDGDRLKFDKVVSTTSAPVSVDFGNDHMYVAGATTVDSFALRGNTVDWLDGTSGLELAGGGAPPSGSTAQVGVLDDKQLLITLKAIRIRARSISCRSTTAAWPARLRRPFPHPRALLTPFGFAVYRDGTAVITLAHSNQDGLFRNGAFTSVVDAEPGG